MPTPTTADILAPELLAHIVSEDRPIAVGDLVVMVDYAGREIGARVTHVMGDDIVGRVCGLAAPKPYRIGDQISRTTKNVKRAI